MLHDLVEAKINPNLFKSLAGKSILETFFGCHHSFIKDFLH